MMKTPFYVASNSLWEDKPPVWSPVHPEPWKKQGMKFSDGFVGIAPSAYPKKTQQRSDWGGWLCEEEFLDAYSSHAKTGGYHPLIGAYHSPRDALKLLKKVIAAPVPQGPAKECPRGAASATTLKSDEVMPPLLAQNESLCRWGPGSGTWLPLGGCLSHGKWPPPLGQPHQVNTPTSATLLPLVMKQTKMSEEDQSVVDELLVDQMAAGMAVPWPEEMGLPTVVSNVRVVWQYDSNGKRKPRVITDLRYANSCVRAVAVMLPKVSEFVNGMTKGTLMSKQDMKSGYHQYALNPHDRHLITFIWKGKLMTMLVEAFGWRDAPGAFQQHTSRASQDALLATSPCVRKARVYLDDFFQRWAPNTTPEEAARVYTRWIENLLGKGIVLGTNKCLPPSTRCEILGLIVDSEEMKVTVPEKKAARYQEGCRELLEKARAGPVRTKEVAINLGRLVSIEPAMNCLVLLIRPLFEDLKHGLQEAFEEFRELEVLPDLRNENDALKNFEWIDAPMQLTTDSQRAIEYLLEHWDDLHGQSIDHPTATLLVRSDASDSGFGFTIFEKDRRGHLRKVAAESGPLTMEQTAMSSTAREAIGQWKAVEWLDVNLKEKLRGAAIESVCDNQGFVKRHAMGSKIADVNKPLRGIVELLVSNRAKWVGAVWMPRGEMTEEDALSRKTEGAPQKIHVNQSTFDEFWENMRRRGKQMPNVDAFASKGNEKLPKAVYGEEIEGERHDGLKQQWRHKEVPWMFPPIPLISIAVERWRNSSSSLAYICTPDWNLGHHRLKGLKENIVEKLGAIEVEGVPEEVKDAWRYCVWSISKPNERPKGGFYRTEVK